MVILFVFNFVFLFLEKVVVYWTKCKNNKSSFEEPAGYYLSFKSIYNLHILNEKITMRLNCKCYTKLTYKFNYVNGINYPLKWILFYNYEKYVLSHWTAGLFFIDSLPLPLTMDKGKKRKFCIYLMDVIFPYLWFIVFNLWFCP